MLINKYGKRTCIYTQCGVSPGGRQKCHKTSTGSKMKKLNFIAAEEFHSFEISSRDGHVSLHEFGVRVRIVSYATNEWNGCSRCCHHFDWHRSSSSDSIVFDGIREIFSVSFNFRRLCDRFSSSFHWNSNGMRMHFQCSQFVIAQQLIHSLALSMAHSIWPRTKDRSSDDCVNMKTVCAIDDRTSFSHLLCRPFATPNDDECNALFCLLRNAFN